MMVFKCVGKCTSWPPRDRSSKCLFVEASGAPIGAIVRRVLHTFQRSKYFGGHDTIYIMKERSPTDYDHGL